MRSQADVRQRYGFMSSRPNPQSHPPVRRHRERALPCLVAVEVAFPGGNDDGGNAVADQVAERTRHADEPVDSTSTSPIAGIEGTAFNVAATPVFFLRRAAGTTYQRQLLEERWSSE